MTGPLTPSAILTGSHSYTDINPSWLAEPRAL
jgi:hypothetical protein